MLEDIYDPKNAVSDRKLADLCEKCPCKPEMLKLLRLMMNLSPYQVGVIIGYTKHLAEESQRRRIWGERI